MRQSNHCVYWRRQESNIVKTDGLWILYIFLLRLMIWKLWKIYKRCTELKLIQILEDIIECCQPWIRFKYKMFCTPGFLQNHNRPRVCCCKYLSLHSCLSKTNGTIYGMPILTSFLHYLYIVCIHIYSILIYLPI